MKLAEKYLKMHETKIPQEQLKRAEVRKEKSAKTLDPEEKKIGLESKDIVGWFATKYNMAFGYNVFKATEDEKKEFGNDVFRTFSHKSMTASIAKINLKSGMVCFVDNAAYTEGDLKWGAWMPYNRFVIDNDRESFDAFNIV
jgi:hypothetical protein